MARLKHQSRSEAVVLGIAGVLIVLFGFVANSFAAPTISSVSGTVVNGGSITINGSSFGTKAIGGPLVWDTFDVGTGNVAGHAPTVQNLTNGWVWAPTNSSPTYSSAVVRGVSRQSSLHNFTSVYNQGLEIDTQQNTYYFTFWMYYQKTSTNWSRNTKPFILYGSSADYQPEAYMGYGLYGSDPQLRNNIIDNNGAVSGGSTIWGSTTIDQIQGRWVRFEALLKQSSPGSTNGSFQVWVHNPDQSVIRLDLSNTAYCTRNSSNVWRYLEVMPYSAIDNGNTSKAYVDDFYLDNTPARVEIGNASTWSACTHREIQVPSTWSSGSVTMKFNQGTFQSGQTLYLYVIDANNQPSAGFPITIGGTGTPPPSGTDNPPTVSISSPTSLGTYNTTQSSMTLSGTAGDDKGVALVAWTNSMGGNGTATNSSGNWSSWSISNIPLQLGSNVITVTATDTTGQTKSAILTVTYSSSGTISGPTWSATQQTGDGAWKDSAVTRCVRLLIQGNKITQSGNIIQLGFQGKSSTSYTIQEVSIAEKDPNVPQGNVVDATWTRVTFDGHPLSTWRTDITTIPAGSEKLSDAIPFTIQPNKDYYVTFKINSPSLYLDPTATYAELYFDTTDHTGDIDWAGKGYLSAQIFHALSSIRISAGPAVRPAAPQGLTITGVTN